MPKLLSVKGVADALDISEAQVLDLMKNRGLPYIEGIGRGRRILDEDLWVWVRRQRVIQEDERELDGN